MSSCFCKHTVPRYATTQCPKDFLPTSDRKHSDVTHEQHGERLAHDGVEEVVRAAAADHEEVLQEEQLAAAVVEQRVVLAAEQQLERVLPGKQTRSHSCDYPLLVL